MTDKVQTVAALFKKLFSSYPHFQPNDEAMQAYFEAVEPYDVRDIEAAVRAFLTGSILETDPSFAPSAPLVGFAVRKQMNLRLDRENRERALHPKLPPPDLVKSPESKARVAALIDGLAKRWSVGDDPEARDD